eukprot:TRINITY_DN9517_c0_g1_i1.p1 TRINITY_DN9517_c0_g1~~TRINITY_DN9517_c0_g1_i1.p1  ORF type:complete len:173 (-),score=8.83 TRINITY_DN9517_c0_g1_i1:268-786(-)
MIATAGSVIFVLLLPLLLSLNSPGLEARSLNIAIGNDTHATISDSGVITANDFTGRMGSLSDALRILSDINATINGPKQNRCPFNMTRLYPLAPFCMDNGTATVTSMADATTRCFTAGKRLCYVEEILHLCIRQSSFPNMGLQDYELTTPPLFFFSTSGTFRFLSVRLDCPI